MTLIRRRRFIEQSALALLGGNVLVNSAYALDGFVTATTRFGKVRGVETGRIEVVQGIVHGQTRVAGTGSCRH